MGNIYFKGISYRKKICEIFPHIISTVYPIHIHDVLPLLPLDSSHHQSSLNKSLHVYFCLYVVHSQTDLE